MKKDPSVRPIHSIRRYASALACVWCASDGLRNWTSFRYHFTNNTQICPDPATWTRALTAANTNEMFCNKWLARTPSAHERWTSARAPCVVVCCPVHWLAIRRTVFHRLTVRRFRRALAIIIIERMIMQQKHPNKQRFKKICSLQFGRFIGMQCVDIYEHIHDKQRNR